MGVHQTLLMVSQSINFAIFLSFWLYKIYKLSMYLFYVGVDMAFIQPIICNKHHEIQYLCNKKCNMAFIKPMHQNKPNITYFLTRAPITNRCLWALAFGNILGFWPCDLPLSVSGVIWSWDHSPWYNPCYLMATLYLPNMIDLAFATDYRICPFLYEYAV